MRKTPSVPCQPMSCYGILPSIRIGRHRRETKGGTTESICSRPEGSPGKKAGRLPRDRRGALGMAGGSMKQRRAGRFVRGKGGQTRQIGRTDKPYMAFVRSVRLHLYLPDRHCPDKPDILSGTSLLVAPIAERYGISGETRPCVRPPRLDSNSTGPRRASTAHAVTVWRAGPIWSL
jgi:hypothetical protein